MLECLKSPKEWAKIARNFPGRTQHQIKNRFIRVLSKELELKRKKINDLMKINSIVVLVFDTLKSLKSKKQENDPLFYYKEENEQTEDANAKEINEINRDSFSFQRRLFEEDAIDKLFYQENKKQNIEDFIKFDL